MPVKLASHTWERTSVQECSSPTPQVCQKKKRSQPVRVNNKAVIIKQDDRKMCSPGRKKREQKRSKEIIKTDWLDQRVCLCVPISRRIWFIPQRVLLFFVLAGTQRQHLRISAHPVLPGERSRHTADLFVCQLPPVLRLAPIRYCSL